MAFLDLDGSVMVSRVDTLDPWELTQAFMSDIFLLIDVMFIQVEGLIAQKLIARDQSQCCCSSIHNPIR